MSTNSRSIRWYRKNAEKYTAHVRDPEDSIYHAYYEKPAMYKLVPDLRDKKVISLGCGSGEDSAHLKKIGASKSIGIDISPELIGIATASHSDCDFRVMDMEKLNFPDRIFDFAYSSLAIHYLKNWTKVFQEVFRILKPGSNFLFSVGHPVNSAMVVTEDNTKTRIRELSVIKKKASNQNIIIGDYLNRKRLSDGLGKFGTVTTWHKSISEIITEATNSGFLVDRFVEPKPLRGMQKYSKGDYEKLVRIPAFMIVRLLKR